MMRQLLVAMLLLALLSACAGAPERPQTVRQALLALGERAASEVAAAPPLPQPQADQVLLLATPEVDRELGIAPSRLLEGLARGLLAIDQGPQVLDWAPTLPAAGDNQWRLDSRLESSGPRLTLSDRELLPYRLHLRLRRPGSATPLWQTSLVGALDATAL
ncbi:MAG TPA: hypothetical protein VK991_15830 [Halomonas sp.]|nr:hypothetical protein [Halomonas sp.]